MSLKPAEMSREEYLKELKTRRETLKDHMMNAQGELDDIKADVTAGDKSAATLLIYRRKEIHQESIDEIDQAIYFINIGLEKGFITLSQNLLQGLEQKVLPIEPIRPSSAPSP